MQKLVVHIWQSIGRCVCMLVLLCGFVCSISSCQWHEAKDVIAMADSLDQTEHVIYDDTAALRQTIRTLDNPFGRLLMSNTLGKAYYYMGRNLEDYHQQVAEAAACYIEADRLQIADPIYRGRVNSCMGYICAQNNNDSLALIFYERASEDFKESGNEERYAQSLLNIISYYINLHSFIKADSLLQIAQSYQLNSAYQARYYETKGLYLYEQQQHDSALVYFQEALSYWQSPQDRCFSWLKILQIYYRINQVESAVPYAEWIVANSGNPNYCSNAHYILIENAKANNNVESLATYSHQREDINRLLEQQNKLYSLALQHLQTYLSNPHPWRWVWITVLCIFILSVLLAIGITKSRKYAITHLSDATTCLQDMMGLLHDANEKIVELEGYKNKQLDEYNFDKCLTALRAHYPQPCRQWVGYYQLKKDVEPYLHDWISRLEKLNLSEKEKIFCVLTLLYPHASTTEMATYICYASDGVRVLKYRLAKKIGVKTSELFDFLYKLAF